MTKFRLTLNPKAFAGNRLHHHRHYQLHHSHRGDYIDDLLAVVVDPIVVAAVVVDCCNIDAVVGHSKKKYILKRKIYIEVK